MERIRRKGEKQKQGRREEKQRQGRETQTGKRNRGGLAGVVHDPCWQAIHCSVHAACGSSSEFNCDVYKRCFELTHAVTKVQGEFGERGRKNEKVIRTFLCLRFAGPNDKVKTSSRSDEEKTFLQIKTSYDVVKSMETRAVVVVVAVRGNQNLNTRWPHLGRSFFSFFFYSISSARAPAHTHTHIHTRARA